jgi:hypothetical protein
MPGHVGVRLVDRDARLQAGDGGKAELPEKHLAAVEPVRHDQRGLAVQETEGVGQDADDFARLAVEHQGAANSRWIGAEFRAPVSGRQDDRLGACRRVVRSRKHTAEHRHHAEHRQDCIRHEECRRFFRIPEAGDADRAGIPESDILEHLRFIAIGEVEKRRRPHARQFDAGRGMTDHDELF